MSAILLIETESLLRRTIALTVRSLGVARVTEATTFRAARELLAVTRFDAVVLGFRMEQPGAHPEWQQLLDELRSGRSASPADAPVVAMVDACDARLLGVLMDCRVARVLIKPFRARDVIDTISGLARTPRAA